MILRIGEIAVPPRGAGVPDFERDRMVSVLDAIRRDGTLPPVEVVEAISDLYSHRLYHGRHRLAASMAVGFSLVPAVAVRDLDEIKRAIGKLRTFFFLMAVGFWNFTGLRPASLASSSTCRS